MLGCFPQEQGVTPPKAVQRTGTNLCDVTALLKSIPSSPGRMSAGKLPDPGCKAYHTHLLPRAQRLGVHALHRSTAPPGGVVRRRLSEKEAGERPRKSVSQQANKRAPSSRQFRLTHPRTKADSSARNSIRSQNKQGLLPKALPKPQAEGKPLPLQTGMTPHLSQAPSFVAHSDVSSLGQPSPVPS